MMAQSTIIFETKKHTTNNIWFDWMDNIIILRTDVEVQIFLVLGNQ